MKPHPPYRKKKRSVARVRVTRGFVRMIQEAREQLEGARQASRIREQIPDNLPVPKNTLEMIVGLSFMARSSSVLDRATGSALLMEAARRAYEDSLLKLVNHSDDIDPPSKP